MRSHFHVSTNPAVQVTGSNLVYVYIILGIALVALAIAYALRAQVLASDEGTDKMKEIAAAVQEGAAAYLNRQFKTLSVLRCDRLRLTLRTPWPYRYPRSAAPSSSLLVRSSAQRSVTTVCGFAVRANVRVAEAARQKSALNAVKIAFRTGGVVGMTTVGLGLLGASPLL
jgi:K(+)-stimulated pyrophosphate-energized sodium pump